MISNQHLLLSSTNVFHWSQWGCGAQFEADSSLSRCLKASRFRFFCCRPYIKLLWLLESISVYSLLFPPTFHTFNLYWYGVSTCRIICDESIECFWNWILKSVTHSGTTVILKLASCCFLIIYLLACIYLWAPVAQIFLQ